MSRKFNPEQFRVLMQRKLHSAGYRSVSDFAKGKGFHRNPLARAMVGDTVPKRETINSWCDALGCTPKERAEIAAAVYADEFEESLIAEFAKSHVAA